MRSMHKIVLSIFLFSILNTSSVTSQDIISSEYLGKTAKTTLEFVFGQSFNNDIEYHKVTYTTTSPEGLLDTASGLFVFPDVANADEYPFLIYDHGTVGSKEDVPSNEMGGYQLALVMAAKGYLVIAPDYIGLGTSRGFHPYIHADSEASAGIDMLFACKQLADNMSINFSNDLFVTGYSQGGHAAMATLRALERDYSDQLPVRACAPMSGPFDVSVKMLEFTIGDNEYSSVGYLPYLLIGYQRVYENLLGDNGYISIFKAPYVPSITKFANHEITLSELHASLRVILISEVGATIPKHMLQDSILDILLNGTPHPINSALQDNDVYDWSPRTPMRLFYCTGDEQVDYTNSIEADSIMNENGALDVKSMNVGTGLDHGECVLPAVLATNDFFEEIMNTSGLIELKKQEFTIYPNPATDQLNIELDNQDLIQLNVFDMTGRLVFKSTPIHSRNETINIADWQNGVYMIIIQTENAYSTQKIVVQH